MKQKNIKGLISEYFIFLIFIALVVVLTCLKPSFIAPTNLVNILKQASINGILAFGMMFVIIAGGFDMSVGSTVAFTGILAALLGKGDLPLIVPLVVAMLAGLAVGMVNGIGVAIGDLPPFIMTLGSMTAVRGLALLTSNGKPITGISKEYKAVAASSIAGIPDAVRLSCNRYHHLCIRSVQNGLRTACLCLRRQSSGGPRFRHQHHCHPHFHVRHCRPAGWSVRLPDDLPRYHRPADRS